MARQLRLLTFAAAVAGALVAAASTAAQASAPGPLRVTIDIYSANHGEIAQPGNIAIRAGGTTTVVLRNHTRAFHTFTIPALGVSLVVRPAPAHGSRSASVSFVAPMGVYAWQCMLCASPTHPKMHAMRGKVYAIVNG